MKECPKSRQSGGNGGNGESSSIAPPRRGTSGTSGGTNHLYALNNRQEQQNFPDVVTGLIRVIDFTFYALLEPEVSLSFVIPYVAMNFEIYPKKLSEPFSVPTPVSESILAERVYCDVSFPSITRVP